MPFEMRCKKKYTFGENLPQLKLAIIEEWRNLRQACLTEA